jgi:hypothetical protein
LRSYPTKPPFTDLSAYDFTKSSTATSTRLIEEVRMYFCCALGAVRYWSESTPMASFFAEAAASKTPLPERPDAWNTMSAPLS